MQNTPLTTRENPKSSAARLLLALLIGSAVYRFALALFATDFTLVDDAYIHLRYARNLVEHGSFVYNPGEAVFGLTSPLYGLVCAALYAVFGSAVEVGVIGLNVILWTAAAVLISRELPERTRLSLLAIFLLAPVFVDNQLLGMETPLLVLLLAGTMRAARSGSVLAACLWFGPALITRPEAVLLSPFLVILVMTRFGAGGGLKKLLHPTSLVSLLTPGIAWVCFALYNYGSVIPQSMVAKTGWGSTHYDSIFTLQNAFMTVPRLSFLPFIDYFPSAIQWGLTGALLLGIAWLIVANITRGTAASRTWLAFYVTYITFYLVGKGATEASWYSVPSSVALLCAAAPIVPDWLTEPKRIWPQVVLIVALVGVSLGAVFHRAPLLKYYVDGYGACAEFLEERAGPELAPETKVAIGEIGVFGYRTSMKLVDVAALVSPETLPWRNAGYSFTRMVQESGVKYFVISAGAIEQNKYPAIAGVWTSEEERSWFDTQCKLIQQFEEKRVYEVLSVN